MGVALHTPTSNLWSQMHFVDLYISIISTWLLFTCIHISLLNEFKLYWKAVASAIMMNVTCMDHVIAAPPTCRAWLIMGVVCIDHMTPAQQRLPLTIMATQEEKQALLGPSTPPVNPASSLPASAPEYEEPPPYTEGPAGPCKLCLKHCKTMVLYSLCS